MGQNLIKRRPQVQQQRREQAFITFAIIGAQNVGKTSLCSRLLNNQFSARDQMTHGAHFFTKIVQSLNEQIKLQIWDSVGQYKYRCVVGFFAREAQCLILVYDITNMLSFKELGEFMKIPQVKSQSIIKTVLVGNKCDQQENREVSTEQGQQFADELGFEFIQTSCKDSVNIQKLFTMFMAEIRQGKQKMQELKRETSRTKNQQAVNLRQGCWY